MSRLTRWMRSHGIVKTPQEEDLRLLPTGQPGITQVGGEDYRFVDGATFCASYDEIFGDEIYRFCAATPAPRIVDCGANCGLSVLYFKTLYPRSRIVAVEADPDIFDTLTWNVTQRGWSDVALVNKAVAVGCDEVTFHRQGADAGRIHPLRGAVGTCSVPVVELDELLSEPTDLLKIDIEGAETEVLAGCRRLDMVSMLFVEYHSFVDTEQSLHAVLAKLAASGFRYYMWTQVCARRPLAESKDFLGMDLQVNVFAKRTAPSTQLAGANGASADGTLRSAG